MSSNAPLSSKNTTSSASINFAPSSTAMTTAARYSPRDAVKSLLFSSSILRSVASSTGCMS